MRLTKTDNDLAAVCGRSAGLCLKWDDWAEVRTCHGLCDLASSAFRCDTLVWRANSHNINDTVCTGCREIGTCVAIIIDVTYSLIVPLTACQGKDRANEN